MLRDINARGVVPVEVAEALPAAERCLTGEPRAPVDRAFLDEEHHRRYGRPWVLGRYIFEFAVDSGLRPEHRLLDFGCGALRFGAHAIAYLEPGNYFGVDRDLRSLEAATTYELPAHRLEDKRPRFLWADDFEFSHFATTFDWVIDFSSSLKLSEQRLELWIASLVDVLTTNGRVLTGPRLAGRVETYEAQGLMLARGPIVQACPLLEGHEFDSTSTWWEFVRI
jgi:SAM-dependent methyltransferase